MDVRSHGIAHPIQDVSPFGRMTVAMSAQTLVLILAAIVFSAAGQLLLKSGAQPLAGLGRLDFLLADD